ncbi:MAG: DUF5652 family protein [Patescibacteria group bacterium]|jgi:hypothetical protein
MQQVLNFSQSYWGVILITAWVLPWKGVALWKAARSQEKWWFIAILLVNTLGIFEIFYIFVFSKMKKIEKVSVLKSVEEPIVKS